MRKYFWLAIVVVLLFPFYCWATTYYVDGQLGSDCTSGNYSVAKRNCTGSDGNAYNTIAEIANSGSLHPGDTILIRSGTYTEARTIGTYPASHYVIHPAVNGTSGNYITIQNYPNENVTINSNDFCSWIICFYDNSYWEICSNASGGTLTVDCTKSGTNSEVSIAVLSSDYIKVTDVVTLAGSQAGWGTINILPDYEGSDWQNSKDPSTYVYIDGCTVYNGAGHGIKVSQNVDHIYLSNNIIYSNHSNGISVSGGDETSASYFPEYIYIYGNTCYNNGANGIEMNMSRHLFCYENEIYDNAQLGSYGGIKYSNNSGIAISDADINIYRNYIYSTSSGQIYEIGVDAGTSTNNLYIWGNVIQSESTSYLACIWIQEITNGYIYNNSIYRGGSGSEADDACLSIESSVAGTWKVKNNVGINTNNGAAAFCNQEGNAVDADYNCWRNTADLTDTVWWTGTWYGDSQSGGGDIDDYRSDHESNAAFSDPDWIDSTPDTFGDFVLEVGSPCEDAGTDIGSSYNILYSDTDTTWPGTTIIQTEAWEMGAFQSDGGDLYPPNPPTGVIIIQ